MIRGVVVFVVALLSLLVLKKKYYRHHWTGLGLILIGIGVVGYGGLLAAEKKKEKEHS